VSRLLFRLAGLRRGPTGEATTPAWLLVVDGRVVHAESEAPHDMPGEIQVVDGGWAVEPLADAHVHLTLSGSFRRDEREATAALGADAAMDRVLDLLQEYRRHGIAAVRDAGDPRGVALEAARRANASPGRYAAVLPSGRPVRRAGGYGAFLGEGVADTREAARLLRQNQERGATHAKVIATGLNSLDQPGSVGPHPFSMEELAAICREARALGTPPMVHANGPLGAILKARPDTVEHGFWLDPGDPVRMASEGVSWVPTLGAWAELEKHPELTARQRAVVQTTDARHRDEVLLGWQAGVSVLAGSDAGTPGVSHVCGLFSEMGRLQRAGLPAGAALAAATWGNRSLCEKELGHRLGGLVMGAPAGFVWLPADPCEDPEAWHRPLGVHLGGRWSPGPGEQPSSLPRPKSGPMMERHPHAKETR